MRVDELEDLHIHYLIGRDDPKLPTIAAFKRRGLSQEAFIQYVHELGP